jgi:putative SOS response-associated peptidase YedK
MCGRYLRRSDKQRIAEAFHVSKGLADLVLPPWDYNVAPTTFQPVMRAERDTGASELTVMRWGLVPSSARDLRSFTLSTINARAESLATSATYREPFRHRRCLVPADGFYEWKKLPAAPPLADPQLSLLGLDANHPPVGRSTKKAPAPAKQPYAFTLASGEPFAFAGLWDRWMDPATNQYLESFTIVTTTPNELTATVHDRMPVILRPQDYDLWLSHPHAQPVPTPELLALLRPYPADQMAARPAHIDVGNVRNNHPGLLNSA